MRFYKKRAFRIVAHSVGVFAFILMAFDIATGGWALPIWLQVWFMAGFAVNSLIDALAAAAGLRREYVDDVS